MLYISLCSSPCLSIFSTFNLLFTIFKFLITILFIFPHFSLSFFSFYWKEIHFSHNISWFWFHSLSSKFLLVLPPIWINSIFVSHQKSQASKRQDRALTGHLLSPDRAHSIETMVISIYTYRQRGPTINKANCCKDEGCFPQTQYLYNSLNMKKLSRCLHTTFSTTC